MKAASIASVDCTENSETCQRFEVRGYPTLLYFSHGKMYKYKGKRDLAGFKAFIEGGYKDVDGVDIPPEQTFTDKLSKTAKQVKSEVKDLVKEVFNLAGYGDIQDSIKWGIVVSIFVVPILLMICCIMICSGNNPEEQTEPKDDTKKSTWLAPR